MDNSLPPVTSGLPEMTPEQLDASFAQLTAHPLPTHLPQAQAPAAAQPTGPVNVVNPEGKIVSIDGSEMKAALEEGYTPATPDQVDHHFKEEKYGTAGQQLKTAAEGAASAATFGLSTGLEVATGLAKPEDIQNRREINPGSHAIGQGAGLVATALVPGLGEASAAKVLWRR